jgi:hypothetical protein
MKNTTIGFQHRSEGYQLRITPKFAMISHTILPFQRRIWTAYTDVKSFIDLLRDLGLRFTDFAYDEDVK